MYLIGASVELLHVKTAPNYPIRKAVRASMSLPIVLQPCRDHTIRSLVAHRHSNSEAFEQIVKKRSSTSSMNRQASVSKQTGDCRTMFTSRNALLSRR